MAVEIFFWHLIDWANASAWATDNFSFHIFRILMPALTKRCGFILLYLCKCVNQQKARFVVQVQIHSLCSPLFFFFYHSVMNSLLFDQLYMIPKPWSMRWIDILCPQLLWSCLEGHSGIFRKTFRGTTPKFIVALPVGSAAPVIYFCVWSGGGWPEQIVMTQILATSRVSLLQ